MQNEIIKFLRQRDFKFIKELGSGAFGKTVLLKDESIDHEFVCKKYIPLPYIDPNEFFSNFVNEIKLMHLIYHKNIVRIFNYYLYPEKTTGFIIMEHINGDDIYTHITNYPENFNSIFEQTIDGFCYLEEHNILHRDIRPSNIFVDDLGNVKIIDFGFGKNVHLSEDNEKSISINWWGDELPYEFKSSIYDHKTEIFFVGKLFEDLLANIEVSFKYETLLSKMIEVNPINRVDSFSKILKEIKESTSIESLFNEDEKKHYQHFSSHFSKAITKREVDAKMLMDVDQVIKNFDNLYKHTMLEDYINTRHVLKAFIRGSYYFRKTESISSEILLNFLKLFQKSSKEKQNIILYNLQTRFEDIDVYKEVEEYEIPF